MFKVGDKVRLLSGIKSIGTIIGRSTNYWLIQFPLDCPQGIKTVAFNATSIEKEYKCKISNEYSYRGAGDGDMEHAEWNKSTISHELVQMYQK